MHEVSVLLMKTDSFTEEDFRILGNLHFTSLQVSILYLNNIYSCEVLKDILKVNRWVEQLGHVIKNDMSGLDSSCLAEVESYETRIMAI